MFLISSKTVIHPILSCFLNFIEGNKFIHIIYIYIYQSFNYQIYN